jgi:hypothetical protein
MKTLTRETFSNAVFSRDEHKCIVCDETANLDAHHLMERRLFVDDIIPFGYHIDNGVTLCSLHHLEAEQTTLSVEHLRELAGIINIILPEHLSIDQSYDKWGNPILKGGKRVMGELFDEEPVQKMLKQGGFLSDFSDYVKYPRTYHMPNSMGTDDDKTLSDDSQFEDEDVVVTLKMDGENCLGPSTIIQTEDGIKTIKEICDTKYNGSCISQNVHTKEIEYREIIGHRSTLPIESEWFIIILENGVEVELTSEHYVYLPNLLCYRKVCELTEGDEIEFLPLN